ncbi:uncharacterized protein LOC120014190 [Tripterygium wilfordii]|uniref:uncharacterized protein LOC120014190 n=1 Tax=Tripterygium wilfordii TaxID=458696 RepID=UPI0018F7FABD|nr:uncharacterized protein LOC120014190 [Tripterygium wilfordii]
MVDFTVYRATVFVLICLLKGQVMHQLKSRSKGKQYFLAFKSDMSKAYDRVEWVFLKALMVVMNGSPRGCLMPGRGIRQGDPLSPYLFILCVECLSGMLQQAVTSNLVQGFQVARGGPSISHLFFADDSLFFSSGQQVNPEKSNIFFNPNTPEARRVEVSQWLGIANSIQHQKYLGLPAFIGRSKKEIFKILRSRILARIKGWKEKYLSKGGKEILLKAVAQAIPAYAMSCFRIPSSVCKEISQLMARFWWGNGEVKRGINWLNLERICCPKNLGGLGFRNMDSFNQALLAKQGWRLQTDPHSLFPKVYKTRGIRWRIGDGSSVRVGLDTWLPRPVTFKPISWLPDDIIKGAPVASLINQATHSWDIDRVQNSFIPSDVELILSIPISPFRAVDHILWHWDSKGRFSIKSTYHVAQGLKAEISVGDLPPLIYAPILGLHQPPSKACLFICSAWVIWNNQNNFLHNQRSRDAAETMSFVCSYVQELSALATRASLPTQARVPTQSGCWQPPSLNGFKLNVDGAVFAADQSIGIGGVLRDHKGEVFMSFVEVIYGKFGPIIAEAFTVLRGMQLSGEAGFRDFVVESDSSIFITAISSDSHQLSVYGHLVDAVRDVPRSMGCVYFQFANRLCNSVAHTLARNAQVLGPFRVWLEDFPPCIGPALLKDVSSFFSDS